MNIYVHSVCSASALSAHSDYMNILYMYIVHVVGVRSGCVQWVYAVGVCTGCVQWACAVGVCSGSMQ